MEQQLKERLVGAAVLVVLAAIFVPMVLDGPEPPAAEAPPSAAPVPVDASTFAFDLNAPLPGAPATAAAPATLAAAAPATAPSAAAPPATKPAATSTAAPKPTAKPAAPSAATKPAEAPSAALGWAAQVGSFSKQATAETVAADLKRRGFKAFVMEHRDGGKTLYRVRVGPVATREAADKLGRKITQETGQAARPVRHP